MKKIFLSLISLLLAIQVIGNPIDTTTAKQIAKNFYNTKYAASQKNLADFELVYQALGKQKNNTQIVYFNVFNIKNQGFVIVAGDDWIQPILAYSNESTFDLNNISPATVLWLEDYENEIAYIIENNIEANQDLKNNWNHLIAGSIVLPKGTMGSGNPLVTAKWGQSGPYNTLCPYDSSLNARCVTGCVTVAMGQVMHYWKSPVKGLGAHSYTNNPHGVLSANFENTTYLFDSMPSKLNYQNTPKQINEVATLLFHCGVAVEVSYGVHASSASVSEYTKGAPSAEYALKTYFGYPNVIGLSKIDYDSTEWVNILKNEIDSGRPFIYSAHGNAGGHAFVLDGYDDNNYFHVNWGWTGALDGYFSISALNPGPYSFPDAHFALINIYPTNDIIIPDSNDIVYIAPTAVGKKDGSSWNNASSNLAFALQRPYANPTQIWVKKGIFYGDTANETAFQVAANTMVYGGFEGNEPSGFDVNLRNLTINHTILDGQNKQQVLAVLSNSDTSNTTCDGLIIQNGRTKGAGAGVYMRGGKLINCIIRNNTSDSSNGGGVYIHTKSNALLINCNIYNNKGTFGGGIMTWGKTNLTNCNIVNNIATSNGGGIYNGDTCYAVNSIVWGNTLNSYSNQIRSNSATLTNVSYSAIQGGYEGIANINLSENNDGSSPLSYVRFTDPNNDDYTLLPNSVCINRGNTIAPYIISIDLAGLRRIKNTIIDIGAYEQGCYVNNLIKDTICKGSSYQSYGFDYTPVNEGITSLIQKKIGYNDCDSIVTLELNVLDATNTLIKDGVCLGEKYEKYGFDTLITTKGTTILQKQFTNQYGCDSNIIISLYVTDVDSTIIYDNTCKGSIYNKNGFNINTDTLAVGTFQFSFQTFSSFGCDSIVVLTLNVSDNDTIYFEDDICYGDTYNKNGFVINTAMVGLGTYQTHHSFYNQYGCDSIIHLTLNVHPKNDTIVYDAINKGEIYNKHGFSINTDTVTTQLYKTQRTVLNQYECDSTIHLFLTVNVGITGFDNTNNSISIYPNPTSSYIDITLKNINTATYEATLYDLTGRVLQHQPINETISRMDLSHIAKGFYFLQIKENNKIYHSIKIIKE